MTSPILYKVDFFEDDVGKVRKESKKRVTWTFQLATPPATSTALVVATPPVNLLDDFAPQEPVPAPSLPVPSMEQKMYSVSLVWSMKTGKQHIEMNDEEIWFDRKHGASVCSHAWTTRDGLLRLEVLASGKVSKRHVAPNFRHYDLMINGRTFDELPSLEGGNALSNYDAPVAGAVSTVDMPKSIVEILYPTGYTWEDPATGAKMKTGPKGNGAMAFEEYKSHIQQEHPESAYSQ